MPLSNATSLKELCFPSWDIERCNRTWLLIGNLDRAELPLIAHDILLKRTEQALGMFWSQDNAAANLGLWHAWQNTSEIQHEVA